MVTLTEVKEAELHLLRLQNRYTEEGEPLDPRLQRQFNELAAKDLAHLQLVVQRLCNAFTEGNQALAEKHGIEAEPPF